MGRIPKRNENSLLMTRKQQSGSVMLSFLHGWDLNGFGSKKKHDNKKFVARSKNMF